MKYLVLIFSGCVAWLFNWASNYVKKNKNRK